MTIEDDLIQAARDIMQFNQSLVLALNGKVPPGMYHRLSVKTLNLKNALRRHDAAQEVAPPPPEPVHDPEPAPARKSRKKVHGQAADLDEVMA